MISYILNNQNVYKILFPEHIYNLNSNSVPIQEWIDFSQGVAE